MRIHLLTENLASDMVWKAEWGFCAWIEHGDARILFDTGYSDVYHQNARDAGVELESADFVVLSHFHRDHTRGLLYHPFKTKKPLILHPRVIDAVLKTEDPKILKDFEDIHAVLRRDFELRPSREAVEFAPDCFFLGEIPRVTGFEKGAFFDDPMPDDSAVAFRTDKGAVVVSGCSHSGICNISEHAKSVTGQPLHAVIGGFHLLANEEPPVEETIDYFRAEAPEVLAPVHCVDFDIQARFQTVFQYQRPGSGSVIEI